MGIYQELQEKLRAAVERRDIAQQQVDSANGEIEALIWVIQALQQQQQQQQESPP